ncbi:MAG: ABC transporter ATP-binding protein [Patescibacteria group bacterium]|jgi:ABC-2 type transport system ATP-binding protein
MIQFQNVTKRFGTSYALNGLTFTVKKGEIVGLLGPNGAGKTTTMRLMVGYLQPTDGSILIENLSPTTDRLKLSQKIGYLPENNPLWQDMLVGEYLSMVAAIKESDNLEKDVLDVSKSCDLTNVLYRKIEQLSRGYKQRVGLAAALLGKPEILILDEPTSGLDPIEQDKMRVLIKSLQKKTTIIISTHIMSEVESSCTRVLIVYQGQLVYDGPVPKKKGALDALFRKKVTIL